MISSIHFNQLKKIDAAFRHDFLLILIDRLRLFLWCYFNDKCHECISVMGWRIKIREHKSLLSQVVSLHSNNKTDALSFGYMCAFKHKRI